MLKTIKKSFLAVVLAVATLFALTSCVITGGGQTTTDPTLDAQAALSEFTEQVTFANTAEVKVGEFVMAVGNPLGMDYSVTSGIVSAINREIESEGTTFTAIQTDAAINSGNSGGALVNYNGELIGINTMKFAGNGIEGIGFAIPISSASSIIEQLIEFQTVKRPYIGIVGSSVDSNTAKRYNLPEGIYVESVEENSPAFTAGLKQSDIITKIENENNSHSNQFKYGSFRRQKVLENGEFQVMAASISM